MNIDRSKSRPYGSELITSLAQEFRSAIDDAVSAGEFVRDISFSGFPRGCCGDASELLAEYLEEHGIGTVQICGEYLRGEFYDKQSHAWLLTEDGIIIDITGDQFKYNPTFLCYNIPVYVGPMDAFHRLFEADHIPQPTGISIGTQQNIRRMAELYSIVRRYLPH